MPDSTSVKKAFHDFTIFSAISITALSIASVYLWHQSRPYPIDRIPKLNTCVASYVKDAIKNGNIVTNQLVAEFNSQCEDNENVRREADEIRQRHSS